MQRFMSFLMIAFAAVISMAGSGETADLSTQPVSSSKTVTVEVIKAIENQIILPEGAYPFAEYQRYYAAATSAGREIVVAKYLARLTPSSGDPVPQIPQAFVTQLEKLPRVFDAGCRAITFHFDVTSREIVRPPACNGALPLPSKKS